MALPGTELFNSLYDSGKIKLNIEYFKHILDSLALFPSQKYCSEVSRLDLFFWKLKFYLKFYRAKKIKDKKSSLFRSIGIAFTGLFSKKGHDSKLQTAFQNAYTSLIDTIISKKKRWMSKNEEFDLFKNWDNIYKKIRSEKLSKGIVKISPADTRELHLHNVIDHVKKDHNTSKVIELETS